MNLFLIILVAIFSFSCSYAQSGELSIISDKNLVHLLNDFEILAENNKPPYSVRIIRLSDHGECDGSPQNCPNRNLYIAVSTYDEYPEQKLYILPTAKGWDFIRWMHIPDKEQEDSFVTLEVSRKVISSTPAKGWWIKKKYEIGINPWKGYMKEIQ